MAKKLSEKNADLTSLVEELKNTVANLSAQLRAKDQEIQVLKGQVGLPVRHRLPDTRTGVTHKFSVADHEGYMTIGTFEDGTPGELFITMAKEGSTIGGLMDTVGALTSIALQYGVPMETLTRKFCHQRFEPSGYTHNPQINHASSIIDYVFRWLDMAFNQKGKEAVLQPS